MVPLVHVQEETGPEHGTCFADVFSQGNISLSVVPISHLVFVTRMLAMLFVEQTVQHSSMNTHFAEAAKYVC